VVHEGTHGKDSTTEQNGGYCLDVQPRKPDKDRQPPADGCPDNKFEAYASPVADNPKMPAL